jgi:type I restriction enzyme, R subunit
MMGLIDEADAGERRFGVGHFDLVVIDEAHRSVYRKYKAIFEYFDSLLVGLTATPKGEVDRDTYRLFDLQTGVPTDAYGLDEAVKDGFLVPPKAVSLTTDFLDRGIRYDELSDEEKEAWDALEWDDSGVVPGTVDAPAVNKWLFNADTVDRVLQHLMTHGIKVEDGDRLGKTIIFAKNRAHAEFIGARFDANYPHLAGHFARVIVSEYSYAQSLVDDLYNPNKPPHIAISVDMLDTGIDVPEVVNLVFFKPVRSKTKFWQMIGRGTRLCPDLFGPGRHKEFFYIFDWCRNFEFFNQNPHVTDGSSADTLAKRLFAARVELVGEVDGKSSVTPTMTHGYVQESTPHGQMIVQGAEPGRTAEIKNLRDGLAAELQTEISGMSLDNFLVRPHRRYVEKYSSGEAWTKVDADAQHELIEHVAGLPSAVVDDDLAAKQFDLVVFKTQLALLRVDPTFGGFRTRITEIASLLEELGNVPMVAAEMALILEIQTDEFWQDITLAMLETVRRRLRALVKLIEYKKRTLVYSDFEDSAGAAADVVVAGISVGTDMDAFRRKARLFLKPHENHLAVLKVKRNEPLTPTDLKELERIFLEAGVDETAIETLRGDGGLPRFVRALVGLDREAAKRAFSGFLEGRKLTADQLEFLDLVIDHLTARGVMDPKLLYEAPFTDFDRNGVEGVFEKTDVVRLVDILRGVEPRIAA